MADTEIRRPIDNPEVSHEPRDINVRAIVGFAVALVIAAIFVFLGLYWLLWYYERSAEHAREVSPIEVKPPIPPGPRLQVSPPADLTQLRAAEDNVLHSYGWVDQEGKIVRIPIDRAMEILAERGLPTRKEPLKSSTVQGSR